MTRAIHKQIAVLGDQLARLRTELAALEAEILRAERRELDHELTVALAVVSSHMGLPPERIASRQKDPRTAWARMLAVWLAHQVALMTVSRIARELERDRATIVYALRQVDARRNGDTAFAARLAEMRDEMLARLSPSGERRAA